MGEIRKDNLHESLIEELNELANIDLSGKQDKTDESLLTESKDVIGAINELFQSANNGKQLIASAIGEPLDSNDTFSAMSDKITEILNNIKNKLKDKDITISNFNDIADVIDILEVVPKVVVVAGTKYTLFSKSEPGSSWADGLTYTYSIPEDFTVPNEIVGIPIESLRATISVQSGLSEGSGGASFTVQVNNEPAVRVSNTVYGSRTLVNLTIGPIKAGDTIKVTLGSASGGRYRYYGFSISGDIDTRE